MSIHIDGFEEFAGEQNPASAMTRADYIMSGQWSLVAGRGQSAGISAQRAVLSRNMPWKADMFAVGFAHQFDARGSIAWLTIGAQRVALWLNSDTGLPNIEDKIGGAMPTANRWYYYELEIERATRIVSLYINNRFDSNYTLESVPTEEEVLVSLGYLAPVEYLAADVTPLPQDNSVKSYDDLYINDGPRLSPITVTTRFPTVDKTVEWFRADPSKSHAESLSMHPPKPLDNYVASNKIDEEDRFTSALPLNNANTIVATGVVVMARKSPSLNAKLGVFLGGRVGADLRQDTREVDTDWRTQFVFFDKNQADTVDGITAADFGIKVSPT
jgi:hypothetical protein